MKTEELKEGKVIFLKGNYRDVKNQMAALSVKLSRKCDKILFIDTINGLNPHHPAYRLPDQEQIFKKIYCARISKHYDLLARLKTAKYFIRRTNVGALIINSLTLIFEDAEEDEVNPIMRQIIATIKELTEEFGLYTIIGDSPRDVMTVRQAQATIKAYEGVI